MKTLQNLEEKNSKFITIPILTVLSLASGTATAANNAFFKDVTSSGGIGFYIVGGIIIVSLVLHVIVNHIIKPKEDENENRNRAGNIPHHHHHHHRHHHSSRTVKKTS